MNSLHQVDELVKEYLLFRGFTSTFRALENESRLDKDKGFQVDKVLDELLGYITNSDVHRLIDYYRYLDLRFFSRLDSRFQRTVKKFELCLLRHYLVYAIQHKKRDKVIEFFDTFGPDLHGKPEWTPWFALPYVKNPSSDPVFETFFTKQWVDNYTVSLHNFLATTFQYMPLPSLLTLNVDRNLRKAQQAEIEALKNTIESLRATIEARENDVAKLKHEVTETKREMSDGITAIRRRAASMTNELKSNGSAAKSQQVTSDSSDKPALPADTNLTNTIVEESEERRLGDSARDDEPFVIVSQEEFSEHASAITHSKFSSGGNLIASCDMDNIVRIWSYKGQSFNPLKINNNTSSILSLEWDARSDRFLFLGTDAGLIRVYNVGSKSVVQEFKMDSKYPWVTHLSSSPVDPTLVCAGSSNRLKQNGGNHSGGLITWSLKTMSTSGSFYLNEDTSTEIHTINLNHNGQMLVAGDSKGLMRILDVRSMKSIMEWKNTTERPLCMTQFSFDENSIYSVDHDGEFSQWSIHKPGNSILSTRLTGFPPPPAFSPPGGGGSGYFSTNVEPKKSTSVTHNNNNGAHAALPPRPTSNRSTPSISRLSLSSSSSNQLKKTAVDDSVTQAILSVSPRSNMVAFSADTEFCLYASTNATRQPLPSSSSTFGLSSQPTGGGASFSDPPQSGNKTPLTTQGMIYSIKGASPCLQFGTQPIHQKLTTVDWTSASNTCLLGSSDGSVKVTSLIRV